MDAGIESARIVSQLYTQLINGDGNTFQYKKGARQLNVKIYRHFHDFTFLQGYEPEITNADDFDSRAGVKGVQTYTLDYIWYTNKALDLKGVLETPPRSVILEHTGLPSELFPSDHLPLNAEFSFRK